MRARRLLRVAFLVAPPLAAPSAQALVSSELFVSSEVLGIPAMNPFQQAPTGPLQHTFDVAPPQVPVVPWGEVHVSTFVDYGLFRLGAFLDVHADDFDTGSVSMDSGTRATGATTDSVTIDAPGLAGTSGTFVAVVDLDGALDASATGEDLPFVSNGVAAVALTVSADSPSVQRSSTCAASHGASLNCFGDPLGVQVLSPLAFVFGTPFELRVRADATTNNRTVPNGTASADSDFRLTVRWLGFQDVLDSGGQPVASFSVSSDSGVDWSQQVPEPGRDLAAACAFAGVALLARRRGPRVSRRRGVAAG
jgi:hypothetical protein